MAFYCKKCKSESIGARPDPDNITRINEEEITTPMVLRCNDCGSEDVALETFKIEGTVTV